MSEILDPQVLARTIAIETAEREDAVGDFVDTIALPDGVVDFRFVCTMRGYEGWQWSVTLHYDAEAERWTVNESTLLPTDQALVPPQWIPWKDRLQPSDLSVTDSIGTPQDDERLQEGVSEEAIETADNVDDHSLVNDRDEDSDSNSDVLPDGTSKEDFRQAVDMLHLSRRRVMTPEAIAQTAQRWYAGQHGSKSLSTKVADGNVCATCGFMIPLAGSLGTMFGVCANQWSPDDARVVAFDHGCGQHSDIEPPEPSTMWIQADPAYDDYHIDVIEQSEREELGEVELIEEAIEDSKQSKRSRRRRKNQD